MSAGGVDGPLHAHGDAVHRTRHADARRRGGAGRPRTRRALLHRAPPSGSASSRPARRFVPWRAAPDFDENDMSATFPRLLGKKGIRQLLINVQDVFIKTSPAQVDDLTAEWEREPWDAIAGDEMSVGAALFAERTECPWATVAVLPLNLVGTQGPPSGMGLAPGRNPLTKARDAALRAAVPLFGRSLAEPLARARESIGLPPSKLHLRQSGLLAATRGRQRVPAPGLRAHGSTGVGALRRSAARPRPGTRPFRPGGAIWTAGPSSTSRRARRTSTRPISSGPPSRRSRTVTCSSSSPPASAGAMSCPSRFPRTRASPGFLPYADAASPRRRRDHERRLGWHARGAEPRHPARHRRRRPRQARDRGARRVGGRGCEPQDGHAEGVPGGAGVRPRLAGCRRTGMPPPASARSSTRLGGAPHAAELLEQLLPELPSPTRATRAPDSHERPRSSRPGPFGCCADAYAVSSAVVGTRPASSSIVSSPGRDVSNGASISARSSISVMRRDADA